MKGIKWHKSAIKKFGKGPKKPKLGTGGRFNALSAKLKMEGAKDPDALAASIGRKKYGKSRFQAMAARGRGRKLKKG